MYNYPGNFPTINPKFWNNDKQATPSHPSSTSYFFGSPSPSSILGRIYKVETLQASFVKSDGTTVTINWNGQVVPFLLLLTLHHRSW